MHYEKAVKQKKPNYSDGKYKRWLSSGALSVGRWSINDISV